MADRSFIIRKSRGFTQRHLRAFGEFGRRISFITSSAGFTLIELMVAISITAVLGTLGIAGFVSYNKTQVLQTSTNEVVTMLNLAKSRAQSQIKPSGLCSSGRLSGYSVKISKPKSFALYLKCSTGVESKISEQDKSLPANLSFDADKSFFFPVQKGGVETPDQIVISDSDGGNLKVISVKSLGGVSVLSSLPTPTLPPGSKYPPCGQYGDVNDDGGVSTIDATMIAQNIGGGSLSEDEIIRGDVKKNLPGVVPPASLDIGDALMIAQFAEGIITVFDVCPSP